MDRVRTVLRKLNEVSDRSPELNRKAIATAKQIQKLDARSARWIASDALRELESTAVQERLHEPART